MKRYHWLALVLATYALSGCHQAPESSSAARANLKENVLIDAPPLPAAPQRPDDLAQATTTASANSMAVAAASPPVVAGPAASIPTRRLLVYHAEVRLKTEAMPRAVARLDSLVRRYSGFVSSATETRADGEWRQETTIRVPPAQFQRLLGGLSGLGTVEEKQLSTDDVTAEHADVAARLAAKRAIERQYTTLLGRAQCIKDVLDIESKLGKVREEIEATESRLKSLNDEVTYSTITLVLYQPLALTLPDAPVVSFGSRLVESFYDGWQLLVLLLLGSLRLWPVLLLGATGGWWWLQRRARHRRPVAPSAPAML